MKLKGAAVTVVGLGKTGRAVMDFLLESGAKVVGTDIADLDGMPFIENYVSQGVQFYFGGHPIEAFEDAELVIVSPGVPKQLKIFERLLDLGKRIMGDMEFAFGFLSTPIIAITGTNGKSTVTTLVGNILKLGGRELFVGGNLGTPLIAAVGKAYDYIVVEISSFQLEWVKDFRAHIGCILNVTPDHMDRYSSFEEYRLAKLNVLRNQARTEYAVINIDDIQLRNVKVPSPKICFSLYEKVDNGTYLGDCNSDKSIFWVKEGTTEYVIDVNEIHLPGLHNLSNVLAAVCICKLCGVDTEVIRNGLRQFRGLEHRMTHVATANGVKFFDDSKATNVSAVIGALQSFTSSIILIAGGSDKQIDFSELRNCVKKRVKAAILMGETGNKLEQTLSGYTVTRKAIDMEDAVIKAYELACPGDIVLLSPACASFDMYKNYEERGFAFREAVKAIPGLVGCA